MQLNVIIQSTRPPFLLLTPICVLLGVSFVHYNQFAINYTLVFLILLGATLAHIGANALNEYQDFTSGLDLNTLKTPFSGGSGALPANPAMAIPVLYVGIIALVAMTLIGMLLMWHKGILILPIGIAGLILVLTYTKWINRLPLLCLISPGLGFGLFMVAGTAIVLTGVVSTQIWAVTLAPFFLVNNLLLLNQYPDIEPDRAVGRHHLSIAYGITVSNRVYAAFSLLAFGTIVLAVYLKQLPLLSLLALFALPMSIYAWLGANKYGKEVGSQPRYLAANVAASLLTPLLLAVGLLVS